MNATTIILIFASFGFIVMGVLMLKSKKLKEILASSGMYKDTNKYIDFNGKFNISIGFVGLGVSILNYFFEGKSNYIIISFILIILIATIVQKVMVKKYKV